jgi:hypothetical protein
MRTMTLHHITTLRLFNNSFMINLWVLGTRYELHGLMSRETELFVTTAVTSNPTYVLLIFKYKFTLLIRNSLERKTEIEQLIFLLYFTFSQYWLWRISLCWMWRRVVRPWGVTSRNSFPVHDSEVMMWITTVHSEVTVLPRTYKDGFFL